MNNIQSPRPDTDETIEQELVRLKLTAPRIVPEDIDKAIVKADYHVFPGTMLTVVCLTLRNGFTVTGESACASPENFNAVIGERIALAAAKQKIWPLLGYQLRTMLKAREERDLFTIEPAAG